MIYNDSKYNKDWPVKKLKELGTFGRGISKHRPRNDTALFIGGGYPLVQTSEVKNSNLYITEHNAEYNELGLSQSKLWNAGTLCITIAANIADTSILSYPMCFPDSIVGFTANEEQVSSEYMYYVFAFIRNSILNTVSGSIQDNINLDMLESLSFRVPEKSYQTKILGILASIDKKINNNNRIQKKLNDLAETIYEYWFLQFDFPDKNGKPYKSNGGKLTYNEVLKRKVPSGWSVVNLLDLANITWGQCPAGKNILPIDTGKQAIDYCSGAGDMKGGFLVDCQAKTNASKRSAKKGDILVSIAGKIGDICICDHDISLGRAAMAIYGKEDFVSPMYYYQVMDHCSKVLDKISNGSIQKVISKENLKSINLAIDKEIFDKYKEIANPILLKIINLAQENKKLTNLRDFLLPLLMNGQAKIPE